MYMSATAEIPTLNPRRVMEDSFVIEIEVARKEYSFEGRLVTVGYTHKFVVLINGPEVTYEPDEEGNYRAILNEADQAKIKERDMELIIAVGAKIQAT